MYMWDVLIMVCGIEFVGAEGWWHDWGLGDPGFELLLSTVSID